MGVHQNFINGESALTREQSPNINPTSLADVPARMDALGTLLARPEGKTRPEATLRTGDINP